MMVEGSTTIPLWVLPPRPGAAVTIMCFCTAPSTALNLVLGRSNGSFEVACVRSYFAAAVRRITLLAQVYYCGDAGAPLRIFRKELGQSLCGLQVGRMCVSPSHPPFLPHQRFPHTNSCVCVCVAGGARRTTSSSSPRSAAASAASLPHLALRMT
jgi:hypothetical protein